MSILIREFIGTMVDAKMLFIAEADEAIITSSTIGMNDTAGVYAASDNRL